MNGFPQNGQSVFPFAPHVLFAMPIPTTSSLNMVPMAHEPIHSGHFMTSNPHTEQPPDEDDEDVECTSCGYETEISQNLSQVDVVEDDDKTDEAAEDRNFQKPVTFYKFGPKKTRSIAIDVSLNKLNKCIKVAYNKMTTPKWKDFKGLRLPWKQRIRLNNVIWRAYFLEFGRHCKPKRQKPLCYFSVPDDDTTHVKLEGAVLEGMYWKRKMEAVSAQYKKWRCFTRPKKNHDKDKDWRNAHPRGRKRVGVCEACRSRHDSPNELRSSSDDETGGTEKRCDADAQRSMLKKAAGVHASGSMLPDQPNKLTRSQTPKNMSTEWFDEDDWENAFTDELFQQLNQPIQFPNPRDLCAYGYWDVIHPGLLGLQPSMEEILATLEPPSPTSPMDMEPFYQNPFPLSRTQSQQVASTSGQQNQQRSGSNGNMGTVQQQQQHNQQRPNQYSSQPSSISNRRMSTPPRTHMPQQHQPVQNQNRNRAPQDYAVANMLLDYSFSNQPTGSQQQLITASALAAQPPTLNMPTRQSSSITSQMLMLSSQGVQPQYSTAVYNDHRSWLGGKSGPVTAGLGTTPSVSTPLQGGFVHPASQDAPNFLEANFLQSQAGLLPAQTMQSMMNSGAQSVRNWWIESPLATTASSPLANTPQALTPMTPMGLLGSTTPEALRSPVVRSTNQQDTNVMSLLTSQREEIKPSVHHQRMDQSPIFAPIKTESSKLFIPPSDNRHNSMSGGYSTGPMPGQRSAPATAEVRTADVNPWKEVLPGSSVGSVLSATANTPSGASDIYSPYGAGTSGLSGRDSALSHRIRRDTEDTEEDPLSVPPTKSEFKEEPPMSVPGAGGGKRSRQVQADSTMHPEERKRMLHLYAEQNRRSALKDGFDQLMELIPDLYGGGTKPTNAVVLAKSGEHIRRLQNNCQMQGQSKAELQEKIARLNTRISSLQSNLPSSSGISSTSGKLDAKANLEAFYDRYTREKSKADWRFWVMSKMMQPLVVGQQNSLAASIASERLQNEEVGASCSEWLHNHWRASELRPLASTLLVHLATQTNVLSDPSTLEDHVRDQLKSHV